MIPATGAIDALQALLGASVVAFALVTQLGDAWFYFAVLGGWYWLGEYAPVLGAGLDRHGTARVIGIAVGALALALGLKQLAGTARPPGAGVAPVAEVVPAVLRAGYAEAATADGNGFPSGHALGTTAIWGAVAWLYRGAGRRRRLALAAGVVGVVSLSRVALGVHYVVSVLGGVLVGGLFLAAVLRVEDVQLTWAVAVGLSVPAAAVVGSELEGGLLLGLALGGFGTWRAVRRSVPAQPTSARTAGLTALAGLVVTGLLLGVGAELALASASTPAGVVVPFAVGVAVGVAVLSLPLVVERVEKRAGVGS